MAIVKVNGRVFHSKNGATFEAGGDKKTTQTSDVGVAGYSREKVPSKVECSILLTSTYRKSDFEFDDAMVEFICDSGQTYVIPSAWSLEPFNVGPEVKLTIEGQPAEEMV